MADNNRAQYAFPLQLHQGQAPPNGPAPIPGLRLDQIPRFPRIPIIRLQRAQPVQAPFVFQPPPPRRRRRRFTRYADPIRRRAVNLLDQGYSCRRVARMVYQTCSPATVCRWRKDRAFLFQDNQPPQ